MYWDNVYLININYKYYNIIKFNIIVYLDIVFDNSIIIFKWKS
jgi:hypothetical protein